MSGLCGLWNRDGAPVGDALAALAGAAPYRGSPTPYCAEGVGLAFLETGTRGSSGARRPGFVAVAQSRLDNRDDLVPALRAHGVTPDSSEAQVILAAYEHWGTDCAEHLIGDFAFAVWDEAEQRLFAARDPLAMRPFYYHHDGKRFLFASEIGQLLAAGAPKRIDETMVALYLAGRSDPLELTFYKDVKQLPPAHALLATTQGVRTWRYWDIDPERQLRYRRDADYAEHFRELFLRAVRDRIATDKPIGLFLSGGVDSGSLASAIGWLQDAGVSVPPVHAVSFAFPSFPECDERGVSDAIAEHYGFKKHTVDMDVYYPLAHYPRHGPHVDEPFIGAYQASIETGLAQAQSLDAGLMMGGDRGDLLAGVGLMDLMGLVLAGHLRPAARTFGDLRRGRGSLGRVFWHDLAKPLALRIAPALRSRYYRAVPDHAVTRTPPWLEPGLLRRTGLDQHLTELPVASPLRGAQAVRYEAIFMPLHMRGVGWSERTQAHFGLEFADVYSDRRLAEFVLSIPQWAVQRPDTPKTLLQEGLAPILPEGVRGKLSKVVPTPLYDAALRDYARPTILGLLENSHAEARGYLRADPLRAAHEAQGAPPCFWEALTLEMWLRKHF